VCSVWRSEIPKVFAKKYLQNPDMMQIYIDCGTSRVDGVNCQMGAEMVFDRYEGETNRRCVFRENPLTTGRTTNCNDEAFKQQYERVKSRAWRTGLEWYIGGDPGAREEGGRFDLPPHQIRIKSKANDTELPKLEFDGSRRELSFEWEGMFDAFYSEAVRQEKRNHAITAAATDLPDGCSIVGALALSKRNKAARRSNVKEIRRERIKKWHLENHNFVFPDRLFEEEDEAKALAAIEEFEMHGDFMRCAEDTESRQNAESHAGLQATMSMLDFFRKNMGVREDDEEGMNAVLMHMLGGPPRDDDESDHDESDHDESDDAI
jgi:hypothetical protein